MGVFFSRRTSSLPQGNYHPEVFYEKLDGEGAINESSVKAVVRAVVPHAAEASDEEMSISVVQGGITNQLFRVSFGEASGMLGRMFGQSDGADKGARPPVLVRIFGAEGMIDRDLENATFEALAESGIGPGYYGRFGNGRAEVFLEGAAALTLDQMADPKIALGIAEQMARLHSYVLPKALQRFYSQPSLWPQLWSWLNQARRDVGAGKLQKWGAAVQERFEKEFEDLVGGVSFKKAQAELKELERRTNPRSPTVFCNNDLLQGNILLFQDTGRIQFIDFEYGGCNYRGFEIANHWNEYAGGTQVEMNGRTEYERFPTEAQQRDFCRAYLHHSRRCKSSGSEEECNGVEDEAVEALLAEVRGFVLVNHWYWGLWAVNQAVAEGVQEFDYLTYAANRMGEYYKVR